MTKTSQKASQPKWSIIEFYERSWHLLWEHKKLWILGFAAMAFSAGSNGNSRINVPDSSRSNESQEIQTQEEIEPPMGEAQVGEDSNQMDGDTIFVSDSGGIYELESKDELLDPEFLAQIEADENQMVQKWWEQVQAELRPVISVFRNIPSYIYILLGLEILAFLVYSIVLSLVANAWAEASLMRGVHEAHDKNKVELTKISKFALSKIKSFLWVKYIPVIRFVILALLAVLGVTVAVVILSASLGDMLPIVATLVFVIGFLTFAYLLVRLSMRLIYAKWHCVINDMSGKESFAAGITTATGNLRKTFWLIFINALASTLSLIFFAVPAIIIILALVLIIWLSGLATAFAVWKAIAIVPMVSVLMLTMIVIFSFVAALLQVFFSSVWYLAFKAIKKS